MITAGFPYFARLIVPEAWRSTPGLAQFNDNTRWFKMGFDSEIIAITELLDLLRLDPDSGVSQPFTPPEKMVSNGLKWAKRNHSRHWVIGTLHEYGAIALDLRRSTAVFCPVASEHKQSIENTAGAGDVFRGAFCYALLKYRELVKQGQLPEDMLMQRCTEFGVRMASIRCTKFSMMDVYASFRDMSAREHM